MKDTVLLQHGCATKRRFRFIIVDEAEIIL